MDTIYSITRRPDGFWETKNIKSKKVSGSYPTKVAAVTDAQKIVSKGATVIVHGIDGKVRQVLGAKDAVKRAPVKRRLTSKEINIAIASILDA